MPTSSSSSSTPPLTRREPDRSATWPASRLISPHKSKASIGSSSSSSSSSSPSSVIRCSAGASLRPSVPHRPHSDPLALLQIQRRPALSTVSRLPSLHPSPTATTHTHLHLPSPSSPFSPTHTVAPQPAVSSSFLPFEDDLDHHPENHFLSPVQMYEYEDWAEDSSGDEDNDQYDDELEWDAGITDFALFHNDRRRASERHEQVPDRWETLLANQASALQRAVERNRVDSDSARARSWTPLIEDMPQLTPDNSPDIKGSSPIRTRCIDPSHLRPVHSSIIRPPVPDYLSHLSATDADDAGHFGTTCDEEDDDGKEDGFLSDDDDYDDDAIADSDEDDLSISYVVARARQRRWLARQLERPGLRSSRTMSGKVHVWRRPSLQIYAVDEDVEAEERATQACAFDE